LSGSVRNLVRLVLAGTFFLASLSLLRADGGAVRVCERAGDYRITVFTAPTPLRAGPVDISVLAQDAATGECVPQARVTVCLTPPKAGPALQCSATTEAATNKLFRAALVRLPEPGLWNVAVAVEGPHGQAGVWFTIKAEEPLPRWLDLWPWFSWPAIVVALFGIHEAMVRHKAPQVRNAQRRTSPASCVAV
jgi:hypothetical protein